MPCGCGSVLLWQRGNTICTSAVMDDVTFGCNEYDAGMEAALCSDGHERYGDTWAESGVYECLFILE